ncbi:uncharacterized protein K460DRAFT_352877 [Cucurbitaria berberidis CBS 394.84]|uniref:Rhodopsin domain-containing protein n=1 Tax=Cucurbitaria berberidis CBS 394.84 TaxID=1168544 RepID=A0A9P4GMJ3_9PLEO|nr:uncharacterized protein K460DRAFT_352877 [Cucurbitaria berberidis CBS 394.84]KAF1847796.1 hypothetical protein K460DRAFT_352877 [Cucurbitaria berberidis CBS 394.84]
MAVSPLEAALIETWSLFAVGSIFIMLRVFSRLRMVGISGFCADDYMVFFAWACYAVMTVAAHIVAGTGDTSYLTPEQLRSMTPEQVVLRQNGTKWFMVGWYTYVGLIWTLKLNMLFFYRRVVSVVWVNKFLVPTMVFVGGSGVSIWILFALGCRPFDKLWQVYPHPGPYCTPQSPAFLITVLTLNLLTDTCIILIPIPIILPLRISWPRKLGLVILFCAGIFIMTAAILRVCFVLKLKQGETAAIWSCREDVVAVIIGQATMIRPLFTRRFWTNKPTGSSAYASNQPSNGNESHELSRSGNPSSKASWLRLRPVKDQYDVSVLRTKANESEEEIVGNGQKIGFVQNPPSPTSDQSDYKLARGITIKREIGISREDGKHEYQQNWKAV